MKIDMLDFNVIKFFGIITSIGKVLCPFPLRWEFPLLGWVKINTDGAARGYPGLATCGGIFCGSIGKFIGVFFAFLEVQTTMITEFYGVIHAMEEAQRWRILMYDLNVILPWFVLHLLLGVMFYGCFVIDEILVLITVGKSGLGLLIFFVKGMRVLISWLI